MRLSEMEREMLQQAAKDRFEADAILQVYERCIRQAFSGGMASICTAYALFL